MNQMEKNEFKERINGMDEEEKRLALQLFSNETLIAEVGRRIGMQDQIIRGVHAALKLELDQGMVGNETE